MSDKPAPVKQEFYEEQRERFDADLSTFDLKRLKEGACDHYFVRRTATEVGCKNCTNGWRDMGRFVLDNGKLVAIK